MKMKDFLDMKPGTIVKTGGRRARLDGMPQIGGGYGSTKEYGWAYFRYVDTGRRVTKRHRQVEVVI